jgi:membrane protein required for beta-lactamase induction
VVHAALVQVNVRVLSVVFWFYVLGPVGAVLYRFSHLLITDSDGKEGVGAGFADAALRLHGILAWLPARLTAWGYALMGSFSQARYRWQVRAFDWVDDWVAGNAGVLIASGTGALELPDAAEGDAAGAYTVDAVKDALRLVDRTSWLWLAIIILLALPRWL